MGTATLTVRPLQPTIGAEIGEIDLRGPIGDDTRDEIKNLLLEHKVLFFRDQEIDRKQQAAFAARFGPLYIHPMSKGADDARAISSRGSWPKDYKLRGVRYRPAATPLPELTEVAGRVRPYWLATAVGRLGTGITPIPAGA